MARNVQAWSDSAPVAVADAAVQGYALAVDAGPEMAAVASINGGLSVFDVSDPTRPHRIGHFHRDHAIYGGVTINDGHVFYAEPSVGLEIFSISQCWNMAPVAGFYWSAYKPRVGRNVHFLDASSGRKNSWLWNFDDGTTSTELDPRHTFLSPGVYDVSLAISGPTGSDIITKKLNIAPPFPRRPAGRR